MSRTIRRGLLAGAAGTAALNAATYLDMALRGRPASTVPERTVEAAADRTGIAVPGGRSAREARTTALGALGGVATGLAVGVAASAARTAGLRLPPALDTLATGGAALVLGNASSVRLGTTDPRGWSASDWTADVVPHLAFGLAASAVLRESEPRELDRSRPVHVSQPPKEKRPRGVLSRSAMIGFASGIRSSFGIAAVVLGTGSRPGAVRKVVAAAPVAGELTADKLPAAPSRLEPPSLAVRGAVGAGAAAALARRDEDGTVLPGLVGGVAAVAGSFVGNAWRETATARRAPLAAALLEDGLGLLLATSAARRR
ncbi:hypothetical protein [Nocardioides caldifontis]|uniref:hypothetical protein n=1 Tax=Nocardioides caldifontis TaxID=2588938 RepID=UPI00193A0C96|nr:hypothetical protein [Nocardioides caldifontis]